MSLASVRKTHIAEAETVDDLTTPILITLILFTLILGVPAALHITPNDLRIVEPTAMTIVAQRTCFLNSRIQIPQGSQIIAGG